MGDVIAQLLKIAAPLVLQAVASHQATHNGRMPTIGELELALDATVLGFLAEGAQWKVSHPATP